MKKFYIGVITFLCSVIILTGCGNRIDSTSHSFSKTSTSTATTVAKRYSSGITEVKTETVTINSDATTTKATTTTEPVSTTTVITEKSTKTYKQEETTSQIEEYVVYKPSSHYVHRSTCHWVDDECYKISSTEGILSRKCTECNPSIEIIEEYEEVIPTTTSATTFMDNTRNTIDSYSRQLLAEIVWHEAGSYWISQYNKAKIAAGVMNRVNDSRFPNTVYGVLTQPGQFTGYYPGCCAPTQACYDAVDYYFAHTNEFNNDNSWSGDGSQNYFYYQ